MGAPKQKWTAEEEEALRAGVAKHGTGKWKNIQKDPEFGHCLAARSNIDLKDKWRNMSVSASGQGSRDKFKSPKLKALPAPPVANSNASSALPAPDDATTDVAMDPSKSPVEGKTAPRYNALIFEAISTLKDPNGSDISAIIGFIEQRAEVPQNFRRVLSSKLRRFVNQGKLEKVQNCYKIQKDGAGASGQKIPIPKPKDDQHLKQSHPPAARTLDDEIEEAVNRGASLIAEAENMSFLASEAVKKSEQVVTKLEDSKAILMFVNEICGRGSQGEVVSMA